MTTDARTSNTSALLEDLRNDDRVSMQHTAWLEERAAKEIERLTTALEKASAALASAYQAAGVFVMPEHDKRPSDRDQTDLLDLLSRWEDMTAEQIEAFLPWPKEWVPQPSDLAQAKQRAYDAFREWNNVTGFVPRGISYEYELESLLDDAVNFGWNARNGEPT